MEELNQRILEVPEVKAQVIDASLFYPLGRRKATQLINNSDETFTYHLREDECSLKLKGPLFIGSVRIFGEGVETKLKLRVVDVSGDQFYIESIDSENDYIEFSVNKIITEIILIPIKGFFKGSSVRLTKVSFLGFSLDQAQEVAESYYSYLSLKDEIRSELSNEIIQIRNERESLNKEKKSFADSIDLLNKEIAQKEEDEKQLQEKIESLLEEFDENESSNKELETEIKNKSELLQALKVKEEGLNGKNKTIEDAIEQNNRKNSSLNAEIVDNEKKLKELISNQNLFSEELATYNEASSDDVKYHTYWAIGAGTLFALIGITCFVFLSILAFHGTGAWQDVWLTRMPLSVFTMFILKGLYSFMKSRLDKATELKDKKKNLIAIGVIAKDITEPISEELSLSNDEKFQLKFHEKIDMIKSLLLSVSGTNADYKSQKLQVLLSKMRENKELKSESIKLSSSNNTDESLVITQ